jgi:preprotein translocase subunit SecB
MTQATPLLIHTQYTKDLSFESPGAPLSLAPGGQTPKLEVNVSMDGKEFNEIEGLSGKAYEISLRVDAKAVSPEDGKTIFVLDLTYGLFVTVSDEIPKEQHHPLLMIEGPRLAFPFVRQIVAEVTKDGGFPPLMLTPVNFEKLYRDQYAAQVVQG